MSEESAGIGEVKLQEYDYPVHPFAALNPPMSDEESASLELDIRKNGVREASVLFKTPKGIFLLDGRNRNRIYNKLVREGITVTDTGEPLDYPVWYLPDDTTPMQALQFVISKANRRNTTKSQKACHAVKCTKELERLLKKEGTKLEIPGDKAEWVAAQYGVNRLYVVNAGTLHDEATDIFDAVFAGVYPLSQAMQRYKRRLAGEPEDPDQAKDAGGSDKKKKDPKDYRDDNGDEIPEGRLREAWDSKEFFSEAVSSLTAAQGFVEKAADSVGGTWVELDPLKAIFKSLKETIKKSAPSILCPKCHGDRAKMKGCSGCKGGGFLSKRAIVAAATASTTTGQQVSPESNGEVVHAGEGGETVAEGPGTETAADTGGGTKSRKQKKAAKRKAAKAAKAAAAA